MEYDHKASLVYKVMFVIELWEITEFFFMCREMGGFAYSFGDLVIDSPNHLKFKFQCEFYEKDKYDRFSEWGLLNVYQKPKD